MEFRYPKINVNISYNSDFLNDSKYKVKILANLRDPNSTKESIWALINPDDYDEYKNGLVVDDDYHRVALLLNCSVYGVDWGCPILYKLNGHGMPITKYDEYTDYPDDLKDVLTDLNIMNK